MVFASALLFGIGNGKLLLRKIETKWNERKQEPIVRAEQSHIQYFILIIFPQPVRFAAVPVANANGVWDTDR